MFILSEQVNVLDKIPDEGPALIVYYHGAIPIDYYYFLASVIIQKGRTCHSVADHFLFKVPGKQSGSVWSVETVISSLNNTLNNSLWLNSKSCCYFSLE